MKLEGMTTGKDHSGRWKGKCTCALLWPPDTLPHRDSRLLCLPVRGLTARLCIGSLSLQHRIPTKGHLHFYFAIHLIRSCFCISLWLKQNIPISFFSSLQVERCIKWEHNVTVETFIFPRKQSSGSGTDNIFLWCLRANQGQIKKTWDMWYFLLFFPPVKKVLLKCKPSFLLWI